MGRLVPAVVALALVLATAVAAAADPTASSSRSWAGARAESLGTRFDQTGFFRVEALPDGGLVAERDGMFETYSALGAKLSVDPTPGPGRNFGGEATAELPSGKVLHVGCETWAKGARYLSVRLFNADGSVDKSFGRDSALPLDLGVEGACVWEIVVAPDGGSLVVGGSYLLKLLPDVTPDPAFGSDGSVFTPPNLVSARVLADGSIAAVGSIGSWADRDFVLARYTAAGEPDPRFGRGGVGKFDFGANDEALVAAWGADGSLIVGGVSEALGECHKTLTCRQTPIVASFDPSGALDTGFGTGGVLRLTTLTDAPGYRESNGVMALARRPDGSIVAVGTAAPRATVAFMAAFSARGELLPGFGERGLVRLRKPEPAPLEVEGLVPLPNGDMLVSGYSYVDGHKGLALARFAPDGRLVRSFGGGKGWVSLANRGLLALAANASGTILFGAYDGQPVSSLGELRAADGSVVSSFGRRGTVTLPEGVGLQSLGVDEAGGAVVVGTELVEDDSESGVVLRYRPDGRPDVRFGGDGKVGLRLGRWLVRARVFGGLDQGRALVGGLVDRFGGDRFALTRLLPNGRPDPRFGLRGWAAPFAGGDAKSLTVARVGSQIYLAGVVRRGEKRPRVVLLRFDRNGRLDRSFGRAGRRTGPYPRGAAPVAIAASRRGVFVVLDSGPRPLIWFGGDGKVRRQRVGGPRQSIGDVSAAVSGGRLGLTWATFSGATRSVDYISSRPLRPAVPDARMRGRVMP
jgi:uncharacterized delta-60 repeat protein